jgi:hypothetical protein
MLYFLYMSTIPNTIFHHELSNGVIEYINKFPFVIKENQMLQSSTTNNFTQQQNITLLEAQKYILKYTNLIGFTFDATGVSNIQDISRGTIGTADFYKDNSTLTSNTGTVVYLMKNNGMTESEYTEIENDYYFGDLDYVKFVIPAINISNIRHKIINLSSNLDTFINTTVPTLGDVNSVTKQVVGNEEVYVDYYLYVWEDINGPWYNGSALSMTPNSSQLINNDAIRDISFNGITNSTQITNADINGKNLYSYNYLDTPASDTSSNYIKVFKLGGSYGYNNGLPEQSSIIIPSPKYTKYHFLWTYSIKNSYNLIFTYTNGINTTYELVGSAPFFTPIINISGSTYTYESFTNMGDLASHYTSKNVERVYKATSPIGTSYNSQVLTLTIPEQDRYDISENFIKRYQPDDRTGTQYLLNNIDNNKYVHLYENNEIVRLSYNIYIFTNEEIQYGKKLDNNPVDLSDNQLTQNTQDAYPYQDTFVDISYTELIEISDNAVYFKTLPKINIDYGDVPYTGTIQINGVDVSRNRYNDEDDIDGPPSSVNAQTTINTDSLDKYFAYETNNILNIEILRVRHQDLLNTPNYGHLISTPDWNVVYKFHTSIPTSHSVFYTMNSNKYFVRWNYSIVRYKYDKNSPIDEKQANLIKSAFNSGISKPITFDFTEFNNRLYPNSLLDLSYTSLPHYTNNEVDYYYKNLNITMPQSTLNSLYDNIYFNHSETARVKIIIYILKPNNINDSDQQNNYDTRDIDYNLFDLSYQFYDPTRIVPLKQDISIDISENITNNGLVPGQYIIEWNYEIVVGGVTVTYLPFDKSSSTGVYTVNSSVIDIPYNDFLYDLSGIFVYSNATFTNLFLEFAQEDIERFVDYINIYNRTLSVSNTYISFNFNLFTPNNEESQTGGNVWALPYEYQGRDDPRLYQSPTTYIDKTTVPSPTLAYINEHMNGDVGFDSRYFSYTNSTNEFYKLVNTYDISRTTTVNLGNDISNSLTNIKTYIVEMYIPEGQINHTDLSANFGIGSIENFSLQDIELKTNGVHLGLLTDSSNNTIVYYNNETPYYIKTISGESLSGKIRWMMEETATGISVTISVNNKKGVYLESDGEPASSLIYLGSSTTDMSQNDSIIKIYDKRNNSSNILMTDISRTDIIFHQMKDPTVIGGINTFPQSHEYTKGTLQIPYICRMDYEMHDKTNNRKFSSVIRTTDNTLHNLYHRLEDWDISNNVNNDGVTNYFFNRTAENPFNHKYIYGVGFISPIDTDNVNFYYPGELNLSFNESQGILTIEIPDIQILYLKFSLVEIWNAINDATSVKFRYFGWEPRSTKITSLLSNGLNPDLENDIESVVTELSGVDITSENVDFLYEISTNEYYEFNYPQIPSNTFIINENTVKSGIYYIGWTYIINNKWNINQTPLISDYDISFATIIIPQMQHKPNKPSLSINEDISQVELSIIETELNDLSKNLFSKNHTYDDISEVKIHYYLWTPNDVYREDNSAGWILPTDYKGIDDIRISEIPSIYYDAANISKLYDLSYSGGYGLDKNKAHSKTLVGKDLYDLSKAVFTLADLNLDNLPYSSRYLQNGNMVPYIAIWSYELVMSETSYYYNVSIQSDISNSTDISYDFRNPDWKVRYELIFNNNKSATDANLNTNDFYNYSIYSLIDDSTNNIRKFTKVKLEPVPYTNNLQYYKLDNNGNNILLNTEQINEMSYNNETSYLYNLYSTQGVQTNVEIPTTVKGGNWTFNSTTGRIIFQTLPQSPIDIVTTSIYLTFYKRVGNSNIPLDEIFNNSKASFKTSAYNKYIYNAQLLIEPQIEVEPEIIYNSYRCTESRCPKKTTKTSEYKNFVMRYASLFDINFSLASKVKFDCGR